MSAIIVLIIRALLAVSLYSFLGWAIYTIWRELRLSDQMLTARKVPPVTLTDLDNDEGISEEFGVPEVIVGRDPNSDYSIPNDTVSAHHARLSFHHSQWWAEDLQSTNGTFLNDERIETPTVIISGDEMRCGKVNLLVTFPHK